jgi:hypothetical protein
MSILGFERAQRARTLQTALCFALASCAPSVANRDVVSPTTDDARASDPPETPSTEHPTHDPTDARAADATPTDANPDDAVRLVRSPDGDAHVTSGRAARRPGPETWFPCDAAVDAFCACLTETEGRFELVGTVTGRLPREIPEASGMVTSRFDDAVLWTHNDSGHDAVLFAVHEDGTLLARLELTSARGRLRNRDFEDLAAGPCDARDNARSCLYVGDFGDNELNAPSVHVHRLREPDPTSRRAQPPTDPRSATSVARVETMELTFPDGARDTEAMVVDDHGTVWLLTKRPPNGRFRLYSAPFRASSRATLTFHGEVSLAPLGMIASLSMFTAADLHPRCGLVGAYYGGAFAMRVEAANVAAAVGSELVPIPTGRGLQNETVAFTADGYRHAMEGESAPIHRFRCVARSD